MSFTAQLKRFAERAKREPLRVQREVFIEASRRVVMRTAVDSGRARANWHAELGAPTVQITEATDKTGSLAIAGAAMLPALPDMTMYFTNNLPYIEPLENGWSMQAPQGMVKITALEFEDIVRMKVR